MDDKLLSYYNRELTYIRKMGAEFSERHPKVAARLRLDKDSVEDPHVSRLVESFAFLTARIRQTIDDSFPELTESLIELMYPAYGAPMPSLSILKTHAIPNVPVYQCVEKGREFWVKNNEGQNCRFKLCDDIHVLPVSLEEIKFSPAPVIGPKLSREKAGNTQTKSVLKIHIKPFTDAKIKDIEQDKIRFYISAQHQVAYRLLDFLSQQLLGACVTSSDKSVSAFELNPESITFPDIDLLKGGNLPTDGRMDKGYQRLTDYFVFPQKFLFFEINNLSNAWLLNDDGFVIYLHFKDSHPELSQAIDTLSLQLGCAPVINLYKDTTEPFDAATCIGEQKLSVNKTYQEVADVHSICNVTAYNQNGQSEVIPPFYGEHTREDRHNAKIYWWLRRENSLAFNGFSSEGTDTYLTLVNHEFEPTQSSDRWLVQADVLCTNRDLPSHLPFGPNQPEFVFLEGGAGLRLKCLVPPTKTYAPHLDQPSRWQFISQLSLQSFSGPSGLANLKTALKLHDIKNSRETQSAVDALQSFESQQIIERVSIEGKSSMCVGSECRIVVDETAFSGNSVYLFGKVLHDFLSNICAINSFVKTVLFIRSSHEPVHSWSPTIGQSQLI